MDFQGPVLRLSRTQHELRVMISHAPCMLNTREVPYLARTSLSEQRAVDENQTLESYRKRVSLILLQNVKGYLDATRKVSKHITYFDNLCVVLGK